MAGRGRQGWGCRAHRATHGGQRGERVHAAIGQDARCGLQQEWRDQQRQRRDACVRTQRTASKHEFTAPGGVP